MQSSVISGPNEGLTGEATTEARQGEFSYSSSKAGTDHIVATYTNPAGAKFESNSVSQTWEAPAPPPAATTTATTTPKGGVLSFGSAHLASAAGRAWPERATWRRSAGS